jgi:GR25 family glycosyltransferase involved in LPS biosynthesis
MEYIHKVIYINLNRRQDRRAEIEEEFSTMGISAERFPAIEREPGCIGCSLSHLAILKRAKAEGWPNYMVFEDDFMFLVDKDTFTNELQTFFKANIPYDAVMLSYNCEKSEPFNDTVSYARNACTTSGFIVHERFYDALIANWTHAVEELTATMIHWHWACDRSWKCLQETKEFFHFNTRLGKQRPGYSDLAGKYVDMGGV